MTDTKMTLEDWLDDLCVRFIINLPRADLSTVERICFQVEEAQWFYEDFIRPTDPTLPSMTLRVFCSRIFQHCPLLSPFAANHMKAFDEFMQYKQRVPVRGAILLNEAMDSAVLVKGWKSGAGWSFPRGKINMDEDDLDCAIREVDEEIGFDIRRAGLVPKPDEVKYIEVTMKGQQIRLYVFRNIPMDTHFEPKTRKEISKIAWYKLSELPGTKRKGNNGELEIVGAPTAAPTAPNSSNNNKFYMVAPFLGPLKRWIAQQKKRGGGRPTPTSYASNSYLAAQPTLDEPLTEEDIGGQTDTALEERAVTPSIETVEGANQTLQQLLNLQPPSQGLQMGGPGESLDKGSALMALLKKNDPLGDQAHQQVSSQDVHSPQPDPHRGSAPSSQVPHTSFGHVYNETPQPNTPQHHHPVHLLQPNNHQAPPNFPRLPLQTNQFPPVNQFALFNQAQLLNHNLPFNQQVPFGQQQPFHQQQQFVNQNQAPNPQFQTGRNAQLPIPNQYNNFAPHQIQQMQHQQQQQQQLYMNQQRSNYMGPQRQSQKAPEILHPQPLPPQAQSILTRSMLPTPQLPEPNPVPGPTAFQSQMASMASMASMGSQVGGASQARVQVQQKAENQVSPQMNSHTMSLLNAFKTGAARDMEQQVNPKPQALPSTIPAVQPQNQYQQAPGPGPKSTVHQGSSYLPIIPAIANLHQQPPAAVKPVSFDGPAPVQHHQQPQPDTHRSALLDMFKKQAPSSPASGSDATVKPVQPAVKLAEERPLRNPMFTHPGSQAQSTAQTIAMTTASQTNGAPVAMNPELNLPFRAMQILNRPKPSENAVTNGQGSTGHAPLPVPQTQRDVGHVAPFAAKPANHPAANLPVAHADTASQSRGQAFHPEASNAPYSHAPQTSGAAASPNYPGAAVLQGRFQEGNPEQAKKLLSLFGKPQPSPSAGATAEEKGKMKETTFLEPQPKSRVASLSLASASGDLAAQNGDGPTPRRGSATPISPNDRDFLMNYLASAVAKQGL